MDRPADTAWSVFIVDNGKVYMMWSRPSASSAIPLPKHRFARLPSVCMPYTSGLVCKGLHSTCYHHGHPGYRLWNLHSSLAQ
ncbi:hypothetical protein PAXRUDRAFT_314856 [Paxillus rubicundulus Ve08.2h10]|uniref:Unplaced genomic scaffold scaffold_1692, whole genome shotgun sequence n=1 Tax=Paxillus rubicundulus Ve08.2h10 TaxID=930991 RepID=A0A0D0DDA7_9AGAM|nr:hypothetical protein PAXRUDRAFT_314856 [Paxillus rubicundulus Ve08.2h10]